MIANILMNQGSDIKRKLDKSNMIILMVENEIQYGNLEIDLDRKL
jgi:hypothetical protein